MTILSFFDIHVTPDSLDQAASIIHDTLEATRARPGSLGVEVTVDVDDPTHFVFVEKWDSLAADDDYRAWRATPEGASSLRSIIAGSPTLTRAEVRSEI